MKKILIAEDDAVMRKLIGTALESLDVELLYASDGLYALDVLRCNGGIDMLLTDVSMPILDGRQLIQAVKASSKLCHIPVLVISGVVCMKAIAELLDSGAEKFIPKPLNMETLRDDVASCLGLALGVGA
jgi:CheY-like chemotaxis protein